MDILINNAAIARGKLFSELTFVEYRKTIDINFLAYVNLCHLFLNQTNITDKSHILNVVSIAGVQGMTCSRNSDYSASKAGFMSFADALRQELSASKSPVNLTNIYPYVIDTTLFKGVSFLAEYVIPTLKKE